LGRLLKGPPQKGKKKQDPVSLKEKKCAHPGKVIRPRACDHSKGRNRKRDARCEIQEKRGKKKGHPEHDHGYALRRGGGRLLSPLPKKRERLGTGPPIGGKKKKNLKNRSPVCAAANRMEGGEKKKKKGEKGRNRTSMRHP